MRPDDYADVPLSPQEREAITWEINETDTQQDRDEADLRYDHGPRLLGALLRLMAKS